MDHVLGLKCTICGAEYETAQVDYVCPKHGSDGILDVVYDYAAIQRRLSPDRLGPHPASVWRYLPLLPVDPEPTWFRAPPWPASAGPPSTLRRAWRRP